MWILPVSPSWNLVLCGVHASVFAISWSFHILQVGSGFSSDFGEFAFSFRISVSIFVRFSLYSVSIFLPESLIITDCPALLVAHHYFVVDVEMRYLFCAINRLHGRHQLEMAT